MTNLIKFPPNYKKIQKAFDLDEEAGIVFTYGTVIYNPTGSQIDESLVAHEQTHTAQQLKEGKGGRKAIKEIEAWWDRCISSPQFRLSQELEAYRNQYKHYCGIDKDRNKQNVFLMRIASDLSSPQYGNVISYGEAIKAIKNV